MPSVPPESSPPTGPLWYRNAVVYQAHVRSFYDSDGNGIGDFRGLTQKLEYLRDLGVSAIWLLPFYPSPLRDDGYDIADYYSVNPIYGTLDDFKEFLEQAHRRSLRVITELVINHTSDQHPWFQRARRAPPGSTERNFYVWSDTSEKYRDARIIFRDFETSNWAWDAVAGQYYWHRFYSHQPDLNFEHPAVHEEILRVLDFWLSMGVDGLRLDAIPYLYEREGTNCENLPETHAYLRTLRRHVDQHYGDRMLLAEANQWPEDAVKYFGEGRGDECHMAFHFPLMPRLFMSVRMEDRTPIIDILSQTPAIPETCQWAMFLRNHDELTLEMVTEEERDYMYRMYAADTRARINLGIRRRLAPLLNNDRRRLELLNALLLSMPGTPVIYYGDEIGMGDNIYLGDRNGVRTPMHWSSDKNAGFSRANPQSLYLPIILDPEYHYEAVNVETQQSNPSSLFWWMKRILSVRQRLPALGRGSLKFLQPDNRKILMFVREFEDQRVLVVANLSRHAQALEVDLSEFKGYVPVEIFGRDRFPPIDQGLYRLTINPHAFFWFALEPTAPAGAGAPTLPSSLADLPSLPSERGWERILDEPGRARLDEILAGYVQQRRWFGGKARELRGIELVDAIGVPTSRGPAYLALLNAEYATGDPEVYVLPLARAPQAEAEALVRERPNAGIARLREADGSETLLFDAMADRAFPRALLDCMEAGTTLSGHHGSLVFRATNAFRALCGPDCAQIQPLLSQAEHSNTAVVFSDRFLLKLFRRPEAGTNPDVEITAYLTDRRFPNIPALGGSIEHRSAAGVRSVGILTQYISGANDGWDHTLHALSRYFDRVLLFDVENRPCVLPEEPLLDLSAKEPTNDVVEALGTHLESARVLGVRTAELHLALGGGGEPDFAPEAFSPHYQRSLYQSMRNLVMENFELLRRRLRSLPSELQSDATAIVLAQERILERYKQLYTERLDAMRTRVHGDYHLGQVLSTGTDFMILDFEGEPARSLSARRLKRSPVSDVAGMIRSFHYAVHTALHTLGERGLITPENRPRISNWATYWRRWICATYLGAYLRTLSDSRLIPHDRRQLEVLLDAYLLDKAVYEIGYELNNRPAWLVIPFDGILQLLKTGAA
ncbi:maltose alpha-D-glucosyltransferase [Opitutaceae bacterium EW11]|nr:maltose alpha-D-glucosyltransferase [Opitutaceae bacterium EW11]